MTIAGSMPKLNFSLFALVKTDDMKNLVCLDISIVTLQDARSCCRIILFFVHEITRNDHALVSVSLSASIAKIVLTCADDRKKVTRSQDTKSIKFIVIMYSAR